MALDKNPRQFWMTVTEIEANVMPDEDSDFITIEFAGKVAPSTKERFVKALGNGDFELIDKTLV